MYRPHRIHSPYFHYCFRNVRSIRSFVSLFSLLVLMCRQITRAVEQAVAAGRGWSWNGGVGLSRRSPIYFWSEAVHLTTQHTQKRSSFADAPSFFCFLFFVCLRERMVFPFRQEENLKQNYRKEKEDEDWNRHTKEYAIPTRMHHHTRRGQPLKDHRRTQKAEACEEGTGDLPMQGTKKVKRRTSFSFFLRTSNSKT